MDINDKFKAFSNLYQRTSQSLKLLTAGVHAISRLTLKQLLRTELPHCGVERFIGILCVTVHALF